MVKTEFTVYQEDKTGETPSHTLSAIYKKQATEEKKKSLCLALNVLRSPENVTLDGGS